MKLAFATIGLVLCASQAEAACRTGNFSFQFGQSAPIGATTSYSHGGDDCTLGFRGGNQTTYESITPTRNPSNGRLTRLGSGMGYTYVANPGFKGTDAVSLKVCGRGAASNGCTNVNYTITVQ